MAHREPSQDNEASDGGGMRSCLAFWYVRGNLKPVSLRLWGGDASKQVQFDGKRLHGSWSYAWDAQRRMASYTVYFNSNPDKEPKYHKFEQIQATDTFRHWAPNPEWTAFIITWGGDYDDAPRWQLVSS